MTGSRARETTPCLSGRCRAASHEVGSREYGKCLRYTEFHGRVKGAPPLPPSAPGSTYRKPSRTSWYPSGELKEEEWFLEQALHRTDAPARIEYYRNGTVKTEEWWIDGGLHRRGAPAVTGYAEDGEKRIEQWWVDDSLHRIDGPAKADLDEPVPEWHYFRNRLLRDAAELPYLIASLGEDEFVDEVESSSYAELLTETDPEALRGIFALGIRTPEGIREVLSGAPAEWVRSYEESRAA